MGNTSFTTPWDTGSQTYRRLLLTGMALIGVGVLLAIVGAVAQMLPVSWVALSLIGAGLVVHVCAQVIRFRDARRRERARTQR
ncbi:hypothetical protein [Citricoccus sp. NR2]|uniref:hypothetical protein n=1 Tax=Citricoccus sp. NR2 TaxID=3004095 RepID=UPI0022DDD7B4|nr:hypothetical protein [Citricoccus sp. NR2]WBL20523.1 hypothetical protein O1A05_07565 [Citricoccus sp. NR2]